jgi:serine/threonine-protein kinase
VASAERYRLVRTLATGGMAQVLEAMAQGMDGFERRVAIKRLLPQHATDDKRRRMFFEEARIGSRLHHGGIVPIFDYGLIDGAEFLAMEFVDGMDALRALAGSNVVDAMPEGIALHIISEVAHALSYVHELCDDAGAPLGIVHRDVSPPNILLSWDGDVKLSDFGIALSDWREQRTTAGVIKGKLHYMAPEQALGQEVSAPADVYALGATLDALLGGESSGPATSDEEASARMRRARARGVSAAVAELIRDCQLRNPASRPTASIVAARAGALATRRLDRDGRGALGSWLQPLRSHALHASALDDLMGLCLIPVGHDEVRRFTVTRVSQRSIRHLPTVSAPALASVPAPAPPPAAARRSHRRRVVGGLALALTIATAGLLVSPRGPLRRATAPAAPAPVAATRQPAPAPPAPDRQRALPAAPAAAAAAEHPVTERAAGGDRPAIPSELLPGPRVDESPHAKRRRSHGSKHALESAGPPPGKRALTPNGWLRVGGAGLAGARVVVDSRPVGFAPLELALPFGSHALTVKGAGPGGAVLLHTTVEIKEQHTRLAPLRVLR